MLILLQTDICRDSTQPDTFAGTLHTINKIQDEGDADKAMAYLMYQNVIEKSGDKTAILRVLHKKHEKQYFLTDIQQDLKIWWIDYWQIIEYN